MCNHFELGTTRLNIRERCNFRTGEEKGYDIGPPTWTEEQRVMRAFWRLQISSESLLGAMTRSLPEKERPQYWRFAYKIAVQRTIHTHQPDYSLPSDCHNSGQTALYSADGHVPEGAQPTTLHPEYREIISVVDYNIYQTHERQCTWDMPFPTVRDKEVLLQPSRGVKAMFRLLTEGSTGFIL